MIQIIDSLRGGVLPLLVLCAGLQFGSTAAVAQKTQDITAEQYRAQYFSGEMLWQTLWIDKGQRAEIESILGHRFSPFRIRYWGDGHRTGWVFEEIGKELPITVAVTVDEGQIIDLTVLAFRESRGGDVVYPFFTGQFNAAKLKASDNYALDKTIDGITGATLSVRALKKIATLALYCHEQSGIP